MSRIIAVISLAILITGCATDRQNGLAHRITDPSAVVGKTWQWEATLTPVEKSTVINPERYTIFLTERGRLQARFDCNGGGGAYTISDTKLTFGPMMSTRMACPPDSQDSLFMRDLQRVVSFFVQEGKLFLNLPVDSGTMVFRLSP